jgi:hypothetical protein
MKCVRHRQMKMTVVNGSIVYQRDDIADLQTAD